MTLPVSPDIVVGTQNLQRNAETTATILSVSIRCRTIAAFELSVSCHGTI